MNLPPFPRPEAHSRSRPARPYIAPAEWRRPSPQRGAQRQWGISSRACASCLRSRVVQRRAPQWLVPGILLTAPPWLDVPRRPSMSMSMDGVATAPISVQWNNQVVTKNACPTKKLLPVREEGAHGQKGHRARQARRRVGKQDGSRTGAHGHAARAAARGRQPRGREDQTGAPPGAGRCPGHAPAVDLYQDFLLLLRLRFLFLFLFEVPNRTELQKNSRKTGNRELMFS
jgi:hypothetical protein